MTPEQEERLRAIAEQLAAGGGMLDGEAMKMIRDVSVRQCSCCNIHEPFCAVWLAQVILSSIARGTSGLCLVA